MPTSELLVAPGNESQARAWDGDEGEIWARYPEFFESSVSQHQAKLMDAAAVTAEARVLDVGCGTGDSTTDAARAANQGAVTGIDLSARMLERARARAAARPDGVSRSRTPSWRSPPLVVSRTETRLRTTGAGRDPRTPAR